MHNRVLALSFAAALSFLFIQPGRADEAGEAARAAAVKTYAALPSYSSTTHFELRQKQGGWTSTQAGDLHLVLDRKAGKVRFEKPDLLVVDDGAKVRVKSNQIADRYLEMDAPTPVAYQSLADIMPMIVRPPTVEMALLLATDPMKEIHNAPLDSVKALPPDPNDAKKRPGLETTSSFGTMTLRMDPATGLVTSAVIQLKVDGAGPNDTASLHYDIEPAKAATAVDAAQFAFETGEMKATKTLEAWLGREAQADGGGGEQPEPAEKMIGKPAPAFTIATLDGKKYALADEKAKVIVLDFWATWCGPCVAWLPHLEAVQAWARKEKKSVAFYAVDEQETPDVVKGFVADNKLSLPVLMDAKGVAGEAYSVTGLPTTVIISNGTVMKVHVGLNPAGEDLVKKQVEELLAAPAPAAPK